MAQTNLLKPNSFPGIEPSRLRHLVTIQKPATAKAGFDHTSTGSPTLIRTAYASIEDVRQDERYQSGQFTAEVTHEVILRWTPVQITPGMEVVFGEQVYKIQAIDNMQLRNILIKMQCLAINQGSNPDVASGGGGC